MVQVLGQASDPDIAGLFSVHDAVIPPFPLRQFQVQAVAPLTLLALEPETQE